MLSKVHVGRLTAAIIHSQPMRATIPSSRRGKSTSSLHSEFLFQPTTATSMSSSTAPPPLGIIIGWLNSDAKHLRKYAKLYNDRGMDTVLVRPKVNHILRPLEATSLMTHLASGLQLDHFKERELVFHGFSMGAYVYAQFLRVILAHPEKYGQITTRIKGQIFDSPPDQSHIHTGLPQALTTNETARSIMRAAIVTYQKSFPSVTKEHLLASQVFHQNPVEAPAMWFYSERDPIAPPERCEMVVDKWKNKGIPVTSYKLIKSTHVNHFKLHPEFYEGAMQDFFERHNIIEKRELQENRADLEEFKVAQM